MSERVGRRPSHIGAESVIGRPKQYAAAKRGRRRFRQAKEISTTVRFAHAVVGWGLDDFRDPVRPVRRKRSVS